ncbi:MAG: pseudouridine synthase [Candidatus Bathyarchaeota archaeon]|nr:pseudouridine synthase [Candidatus Bathyarchaeota archaeon]
MNGDPLMMYGRTSYALEKVRSIADYQFGIGAGERLFPDNIDVVRSKKTGKIRYVYFDGKLLATLKPTDGLFSLTVEGAKRLKGKTTPKRLWVQVQDEAAGFVAKGRDVFARHVVDVDDEIRPREEIIVLDGRNRIIAVGRAMLSGREMREFERGIAVKVRRGNLEKVKKEKEKIVDKQGAKDCAG